MFSKSQQLSKLRILKDLKELSENKLIGISACCPNPESIYTVNANIQIQEGIYKGLLVPILIKLPEQYPLHPPAAYIIKGHPFTRTFHEHIIGWNEHDHASICTDLTSNFQGFFQPEKGSGWSPAYTIQAILIQLQTFFARPDLPKEKMPSAKQIKEMLEAASSFKHTITVFKDEKMQKVESSFRNPYPELELLDETDEGEDTDSSSVSSLKIEHVKNLDKAKIEDSDKDEQSTRAISLKYEILNKLVCPITKKLIGEDSLESECLFGYPIHVDKDHWGRLVVTPVIELMTYEGRNYLGSKSIFGENINKFLPLYISPKHHEQTKSVIMKYWKPDSQAFKSFMDPFTVNSFYPSVMVNTVIQFLKGTVHESYAAIDAYCQFRHTLSKFLDLQPETKELIESDVRNFIKDKTKRTKKECGNLGEVMVKASLSSIGLMNKELRLALFKETCCRQIPWMVRENPEAFILDEKTPDLLQRFSEHNLVSKQFSVIQYETEQLFLKDEVIQEQEGRLGFIAEDRVKQFRETLLEVKERITGMKEVISALDLAEQIPDEEAMKKLLVEAYQDALLNYGNEFPEKPKPSVRILRSEFGTELKKEFEGVDRFFPAGLRQDKPGSRFFRGGKKE